MTATFESIVSSAGAENWNNRKIKDALYAAGIGDRRDAVLAALGRTITPPAAPKAKPAPVAAPVVIAVAKRATAALRQSGEFFAYYENTRPADKIAETAAIEAAKHGLDLVYWNDIVAAAERRIAGLSAWTHPTTGKVRVYINGHADACTGKVWFEQA